MPIHRQSYTNPCQSYTDEYQSTANLIPINCQSNFNSVPIRFQSNQINPRLPTSHHSGTNPLTIQSVQCQSASPEPIHQSNVNSVPICQSITSLPIQESRTNLQTHHQFANPSLISNPCPSANPLPIHTSSADPWQITLFNANPTQHQSTKTIPDRSTNLSPIHGQSPIIHPTVQTDDTQIIPIGIRLAMVEPIRVTKPHLVKGTSTIRSQLLSGRHPICQSNFNPVSIVCQSEGDNCPNNQGTSLL